MIALRIQRVMNSRMVDTYGEYAHFMTSTALADERLKEYTCEESIHEPKRDEQHKWLHEVDLVFKKVRGSRRPETLEKDKEIIIAALVKAATLPKWNKYPWQVFDEEDKEYTQADMNALMGIEDLFGRVERYKTWEEFKIDESLVSANDHTIEHHEAFRGIFERAPHIRITLGAIQKAIETNGEVRNHVLIYGEPGAAKTETIAGIKILLGDEAYISINADSCTKAGFQTTFFSRLKLTGVPPVMILEEIEKVTDESVLRPFLSILDTRGIIQKNTARFSGQMSAKTLVIATANDKETFDKMMGGKNLSNGKIKPGAFSSRFVHQLEVLRPSDVTMRRILKREIDRFGGDPKWIEPCMDLAMDLQIDDPRKIISFLDGGARLLDGTYQEDQKRVMNARQYLAEVRAQALKDREFEESMQNLRKNSKK